MGRLSASRPRAANRATRPLDGERRRPAPARRFAPDVWALEDRQLLSQLTVLNNADSGSGSLRAEIAAAAPGDVIAFATSLRGQTISLASPLMVGTSVTIRGFTAAAPTISGSGSTEAFVVASGVAVNLVGLRIANGTAANGGAIDNSGILTIRSCSLFNNRAVGNATTAGAGGAIFNETGARLTLLQSRLTGNQAIDNVISGGTASGGAIAGASGSGVTIRNSIFTSNQALSSQGPTGRAIGGAIANTGATLAIAGSRFNGNSALGFSLGQSGAIDNRQGVATITNCVFTNNQAVGTGLGGFAASGALTNVGASGSTSMTIRNSLFTRNQAIATAGGDGVTTLSAAFGGAMGSSGSGVVVTVSRSSFFGNQAIAAAPSTMSTGNLLAGIAVGGAIENDTGAIVSVSSSVISGNRARGGAAGANGAGGAAFGGGIGNFMGVATLNLTNTTVAGNSAQGGGGNFGHGFGGGIADFQNGRATLTGVSLAGNRASGAPGAAGTTGSSGGGGAILVGITLGSGTPGFSFPDGSSMAINRSSIAGNAALGGSGVTGGSAQGGGIDLAAGSLIVQTSFLGGNSARGGQGSAGGQSGDGSGGGAFAANATSLQFQRSSLIGNRAAGGPTFMGALSGAGIGGGLFIQPTASVFLDSLTAVFANSATTQSSQIFGPFQRT
jgi:hypothetical protein